MENSICADPGDIPWNPYAIVLMACAFDLKLRVIELDCPSNFPSTYANIFEYNCRLLAIRKLLFVLRNESFR
jgi:hypothetical protein